MRSREEWQKELHKRIFDFREGRMGGEEFYERMKESPLFSFWQAQLDGGSTWYNKQREPFPISELDDDYLLNIWNYMVGERDFMSLVWVSSKSSPAHAHKNLEEDWFESTPLMTALFWEIESRGLQAPAVPRLDYSDVRNARVISWENMVE